MSLSLSNISASFSNNSTVFHTAVETGHAVINGIPMESLNPSLNITNLSSSVLTNITTFATNFTNRSESNSLLGGSEQFLSLPQNRTVKSNYTRNLEQNLSRITSGFAKTFSHSFSMNDRKTNNHIHSNGQNTQQRFMGMPEGEKLQQFHSVPFPNGFPTGARGPIGTKTNMKSNERVAVRPKMTLSSGNSTLPHLPVLWTALSMALGIEVRGELIRGLPCITRFNQLFCRSGGTSYPSNKIERFIDDNRALMRRMHGEFISLSAFTDNLRTGRRKRENPAEEFFIYENDFEINPPSSMADKADNDTMMEAPPNSRQKRQTSRSRSPGPLPKSDRIDSCQSEEEVATPYWASNSRGKILAIVNTKEFSQIIHQEICTKTSTKRCTGDCGCEQKYKYHRLMAYDPDNDCKGIFMDWFLFPSCCSCRCDPL